MARWLIQIFFLILFIFFFVQTRYGTSAQSQDVFFRFDPLIFIVTSIAQRTIIAAAGLSISLVIASLVFGRFFCGFVCPLGTIIDIFNSIVHRKKESRYSLRNGKYLIFLLLVIFALIGSSFLHFFDPLVIFERFLTLAFYPVIIHLIGLFADVRVVSYTEAIVAFLTFGVIIGLGFIAPRFWCRNLCPLGGLLGALSKFSLFKFSFHEKCTQCGVCEEICPTGAIDSQEKRIDAGECIVCLRCKYECPHNAIEYGVNFSVVPFDVERRRFVGTLGASIATLSLAKFFIRGKFDRRLIRPPGSFPEPDFLNVCIHCGKCMKVCPTNGLQPCILEAGIEGFWTPRLIPRIGGCEKNCNMCGQVCPTSAIRKLSLQEKTYAKIGSAVIHRRRCIAWVRNMVCLICDEVCPYNAISSLSRTVRGTTLLRPFVDERICTGCGLCESRCPVEGPAAIQVFAIGEERKKTGSYITREKRELRACEEKLEDVPSGFILDDN